ncbi:MAG: NAD(P)/FAD-dependent oxidoreductase [Candidatus Limnocylindrales bacterium]
MSTERVEVAIVGGGPAGAALATLLARAGREVVVLERSAAWHWRACGVFASPAAMSALRRTGLAEATLERVARPLAAMRVETPGGTDFDLTYGAENGGAPAVGFDRSALDPALLEGAARAGADVRRGWRVDDVDPSVGRLGVRRAVTDPGGPIHATARVPAGSTDEVGVDVRADLIVGADGIRSIVARAAGVARRPRLPPRIGLTYHLRDTDDAPGRAARMHVIRDGYVGLAPVPGDRVNVGIVLGRTWLADLRHRGARSVAASIVAGLPPTDEQRSEGPAGSDGDWRRGEPLEAIAGAWPIGHRVSRRAGRGWLLIGDAAGFLDPFTGEGIHRALASAELAAAAIRARSRGRIDAFDRYERAMLRRFVAKDAVSWLVQAFLARPAMFEYAARRIADRPGVRSTMGLVMGDLVGAGTALDPRYLAALLAP